MTLEILVEANLGGVLRADLFTIANTLPNMVYILLAGGILAFYLALCEEAGFDGPLHECSVYGSKEAGAALNAMLEAGASEPWQDTLAKLTGTREMDATAIVEYFEPLMGWLEQQNEGRSCGW